MGSIPSIGDERERLTQIDGAMPRLDAIPPGCAFHPRCPRAIERCQPRAARARAAGATRAACWLAACRSRRSRIDGARMSGRLHGPAGDAATCCSTLTDVARVFDVSPPWLDRVLERKPRALLKAVDGVVARRSARGETLGLVGESGCGKSTVARLIVGLVHADARHDRVRRHRARGRGRRRRGRRARRRARRSMQMIFQDPYASLNPRWRVADIVAEPMRAQDVALPAAEIAARVGELLAQVGLARRDGAKYPHQFSGGQRQRISIARALATEPAFLVCDEPTSALDVSVQAQVLNLMRDLQRRLGLTYLFISHNLAVVHHIADRVGVMYLGRIVELAPTRAPVRATRSIRTRGCCSTRCPTSR